MLGVFVDKVLAVPIVSFENSGIEVSNNHNRNFSRTFGFAGGDVGLKLDQNELFSATVAGA